MIQLGIPTYKGKVDGGLHAVLVNEAADEEVDDGRQDSPYERADQVEPVDELVDLDAGLLVLLLAEVVAGVQFNRQLFGPEYGPESGSSHICSFEICINL